MKKTIVAVAVLAMVPAAFGAVTLQLQNPDGTTSIGPVANGESFTVDVYLNTDGMPVTGVSYAVWTDAPGMLRLTARTLDATIGWDLTTADSLAIGNAANALLNPKNARDLGAGAADGVTPLAGPAAIETLTFTALADLGNPVANIMVVGAGVASKATWANPDFETFEIEPSTFSIVPEPTSMLLLAAGAAFFARRRRA